MYDNDWPLQSLADLMVARLFCDVAGEEMRRIRSLKDLGSMAVHRTDPIRPGDAVLSARELLQLLP